jgi:hypothetical protein
MPVSEPAVSHRAWLRVLAFLVVWVSAAGVLVAQTPTPERPFPVLQDARQWGPFLVDLGFVIDNIGYDDNVFLVSPDDPRGQEEAWIVRMGPEVEVQTQFGPRIALTIYDKLSGELFFGVDGLDHWDNSVEPRLDVFLGQLLSTTEGRWSTVRQRPSSEFDERARRDETYLQQTLRLFVGGKTDVAVTGSLQELRYDDPDQDQRFFIDPDGDGTFVNEARGVTIGEAFDRDRTEIGAEIGWRPRGRTRLFVEWRFREYEFLFEESLRDSEDERVFVGLEFRPDAAISGKISFGKATLENVEESLEDKPAPFEGTVSETQVTLRPTERARLRLIYEQDARFSNFDRNFYYESRERAAEFDWFLGRRWGLQGGYEREELEWPEPTTVSRDASGNVGFLRADTIERWYGGVLFRFTSGFVLGVRYGYRDRTSNLPPANDEQTFVTTTGSVNF